MKRIRGALRLDFNRPLWLQFRGSTITSDTGLLPYRELDDMLSLTDTGANTSADAPDRQEQSPSAGRACGNRRSGDWPATRT